MKIHLIKTFEYGAAKNGGKLWLLPEINCFLFEWKGEVLLEEWIEILSWQIQEIIERKVANVIGDTTSLGPIGEEYTQWAQDTYLVKIASAGLKKLAIVLPNDPLGKMSMQELIDNMKANYSEGNPLLQINYTNDVWEAMQWIRSKQ